MLEWQFDRTRKKKRIKNQPSANRRESIILCNHKQSPTWAKKNGDHKGCDVKKENKATKISWEDYMFWKCPFYNRNF